MEEYEDPYPGYGYGESSGYTQRPQPRFSRGQKAGIGFFAGFMILSVMLLLAYIGITYGLYDGNWSWVTELGKCSKECVNGILNETECECVCDLGYYGNLCENERGTTIPPKKECDPKECINGQQNPDTCQCKCNQGFEMKEGTCVPCLNACVNGTRAANGCTCYCDPGAYGADCSSRLKEDAQLCSEGTCAFGTPTADCASCNCWPFYSGPKCDQRDCSDVKCEHGTQDELCNCTCDPGWMGRACDTPLTPDCPLTVCYNGSVDSNCNCICDPGFEGQTCRLVKSYNGMEFINDPLDPNWKNDYNKCNQVPGAVWTGYQCMTVAGGCPMGDEPYQCVERGGYKYVHRVGDNDPWQCALADESNGGYIGDSVSYELGGRCISALSLGSCDEVLDEMGCNREGDGVCFSPTDPSCGGRTGIDYLQQ